MCSGPEAGSYLTRVSLNARLESNKEEEDYLGHAPQQAELGDCQVPHGPHVTQQANVNEYLTKST